MEFQYLWYFVCIVKGKVISIFKGDIVKSMILIKVIHAPNFVIEVSKIKLENLIGTLNYILGVEFFVLKESFQNNWINFSGVSVTETTHFS